MIHFSKDFMIKCMINNAQEEQIQNFSNQLQHFINKHFPKAVCQFVSSKPYWKYPETQVVIHKVSDVELYGISRFINVFQATWSFKESTGYEVDLKKSFHTEDAIWSQNVHPDEHFLIPQVSWVHLYTWPEEK